MAYFVIDASVTLSWCFEDETNAGADALLERLRSGDRVCVPAHWPTEVSNGLLMALRKKRIKPGRFELFWDQLAVLPIAVEPPISLNQTKEILVLCEHHGLTIYDGAYLELAKRRGFLLATLDSALLRAANQEGVAIVVPV
jgi:predicted nucleic acid-binding protein